MGMPNDPERLWGFEGPMITTSGCKNQQSTVGGYVRGECLEIFDEDLYFEQREKTESLWLQRLVARHGNAQKLSGRRDDGGGGGGAGQ